MEVITRGDVSGVTLLWQRGSAWVLTIVCKAVFDLVPGEALLVGDPDEPSDRDVTWEPPFARSLRAVDDLVPIKPRVDVIVTGHAHAPGGVPVRSLRTRLAFGAVDKSIELRSDRYFDRNGLFVEGAPFARMPLVYELAAGGTGTWNPAGLAVGTLDGLGHLALPNLMPPDLPPPTPESPYVAPIGYGPIPADWPSRVEKLGRRSPRDLPRHWHGEPLPEDLPRDYFNAAPDDQQLDVLPEDLTMTLENLIPGHPLLTCWLPGICPTIICEAALGTSTVVPSIDTLHIDTDAARCTVVWRGHLPRRDASDDLRIVIALESPRARRSLRAAGSTGEHARVVMPPLPQVPPSRPEPPTFAGTGEFARVVMPPSQGPLSRPEPPTFSGTGEFARVVMPPSQAPLARPEPPTFSGTGEHARVVMPPSQAPLSRPEPPTFSGTGEHPRVSFGKQSVSEREPPTFSGTGEHPRAPLVTAPFLEPEPSAFGGSERPRPIPPARKSEPTALFVPGELSRPIPPARKSEPTALFVTSELSRPSPPAQASEPAGGVELSAAALARLSVIDLEPEPPSEPPPSLPRPPEPPSLESGWGDDEDDEPNPRDTIAPGFIHAVDLPFPIPLPRPTPDPESDPWGESSLQRTGAYPWGATSPASHPTPPQSQALPPAPDSGQALAPEARQAPAPASAPVAAAVRPSQSGQTLPPAPPSGPVHLPLSSALRPQPMSAALRAEVSVPAPPPPLPPTFPSRTDPPPAAPMLATPMPAAPLLPGSMSSGPMLPGPMASAVVASAPMSSSRMSATPAPAPPFAAPTGTLPAAPRFVPATAPLTAAETAGPASTETPWGNGTSGPKRETIGMALRSGSLALAEPRHEAVLVDEPTPAPEPARSPLLLLWFDPESVIRIRRAPQWKTLLDELEKQPLDRDLESEGGPREPWELEDRRDVFELCARGRTASARGCEEALAAAKGRGTKLVPPIVLVEGELEIQLDELEALKAAATTVAPVVAPADDGLRAALEATDNFLRRPGLSAAPAVCEGLQMRLREAFLREKRALPPDYVDRQVERALLTGRHYQKRDVFGGPFFRAILRVAGEKDGLVTYLPEAVQRKVPMFRRFLVRVIADVHPQQDPYETRPLALRVLALARSA